MNWMKNWKLEISKNRNGLELIFNKIRSPLKISIYYGDDGFIHTYLKLKFSKKSNCARGQLLYSGVEPQEAYFKAKEYMEGLK